MNITITAEQLVQQARDLYKIQRDTPDVLLAKTIARMYPDVHGDTVRSAALENSVAAAIAKAERQSLAAADDFVRIQQLDLFGERIPAHKVPKAMRGKSALEMDEWMSARAEIERQNADELYRAAEKQERDAQDFEQWARAVHRVRMSIESAGFDPGEISYEEALKKAEAVQPWDRPVPDAQTKKPVC